MKTILGILGLLVAFAGMMTPPIQALLPKISPFVYFKQQEWCVNPVRYWFAVSPAFDVFRNLIV